MTKPLVSIIFPVYFNELNLPHLAKEIDKFTKEVSFFSFEFIFVDDGSPDQSYMEMQKLLDTFLIKHVL